jgi:hypothetical protein
MNIFVCWSGTQGSLVADELKIWLKEYFPSARAQLFDAGYENDHSTRALAPT